MRNPEITYIFFPHSQLYKSFINLKLYFLYVEKKSTKYNMLPPNKPLAVLRHERPSIIPRATNVKIQAYRLSIWKIEPRTKSIYWTLPLDQYQIIHSEREKKKKGTCFGIKVFWNFEVIFQLLVGSMVEHPLQTDFYFFCVCDKVSIWTRGFE